MEAVGVKALYPGFIDSLLAEQVDRVPRGDRWLHEIKFDGYRAQLHIMNQGIRVFTRRGLDWTKRFRKIAKDADRISAGSVIIDGEIVLPGEGGKTDFSVLQNSLSGNADNIVMVAFDLLYLNGRDRRKLPLTQRKLILKKVIAKGSMTRPLMTFPLNSDADGAGVGADQTPNWFSGRQRKRKALECRTLSTRLVTARGRSMNSSACCKASR